MHLTNKFINIYAVPCVLRHAGARRKPWPPDWQTLVTERRKIAYTTFLHIAITQIIVKE
jgi:hypothetical protein